MKIFLRFVDPAKKQCGNDKKILGNSTSFLLHLIVCLLRDLNALHELPRIWSNSGMGSLQIFPIFKSFCWTKSYISSAVLYLHLGCSVLNSRLKIDIPPTKSASALPDFHFLK